MQITLFYNFASFVVRTKGVRFILKKKKMLRIIFSIVSSEIPDNCYIVYFLYIHIIIVITSYGTCEHARIYEETMELDHLVEIDRCERIFYIFLVYIRVIC